MELAERISHLHYAIRDIIAEAKRVESTGKKMMYLNIGDPCRYGYRPPEHVTEAIIKALKEHKWHGYAPSEGDPELRQVIANVEGIDQEDVFITAGLSEGIDFLFQALLNPGDNFLLPSPGYPLYNTKNDIYGGIRNYYTCNENYEPDLDDIRKKINHKTKAIVVINPNNPTGKVYSYKTLKGIADIAGEYDIPVIADEIYDRLILDEDAKFYSMTDFKDIKVIRGNGLSKVFIFPGARLGYLAFHGKGMDKLKNAIQRLCNARLSTNWEIQRGAIAAYSEKYDLNPILKRLRQQRDVAYEYIKENEYLSTVKPEGAFYMFIKVNNHRWRDDREFVLDLMRTTGIVAVPGSGFSPELNGIYIRIVFLPPVDLLKDAMEKMVQFMKS